MFPVSSFDFYKFNAKLGIMKSLSGIDYHRYLEYPVVFNNLEWESIVNFLDIGTGHRSIFPLFISYYVDCNVYSVDIGKYLFKQLKYVSKIRRLKERLNQDKLKFEIQDARSLNYEDNFFEGISSISCLEHISGEGDKEAVLEIKRVLKPGGVCVLTLPYIYSGYKEQFLPRKVYTQDGKQKNPAFFSRYYDDKAVEERIIKPSHLNLENIEYLGERKVLFYYNFWCKYVPFRNTFKYLIGFLLPLFSYLFFKRLKEKEKNYAQVIVLKFRKT